jgi:hypothetical protein
MINNATTKQTTNLCFRLGFRFGVGLGFSISSSLYTSTTTPSNRYLLHNQTKPNAIQPCHRHHQQ